MTLQELHDELAAIMQDRPELAEQRVTVYGLNEEDGVPDCEVFFASHIFDEDCAYIHVKKIQAR